MILNELFMEIWNVTNDIFNIIKTDTIKDVSVKCSLIYKGTKYKWRDGMELKFTYKDISFYCSYTDYYNDTNDYNKKNILTNIDYTLFNLKGIKEKELLSFLKFKLRMVKIEKLLFENNI